MGAAMVVCAVFAPSCKKDGETSPNSYDLSVSADTEDSPKPVKGKIKDRSSNAVAGATVELYHNPGTTLLDTTSSAPDGNFETDSVYAGNYRIHVSADGYQDTDVYFTVPVGTAAYELPEDIVLDPEE